MRTQPLKFVQYIIYCIIFTRPQPLKLNKKATRQQNQKFQKGMLHPDHLPKKENVKLKATRQQNQKFQKGMFHPDNLPKKENNNYYKSPVIQIIFSQIALKFYLKTTS